jgi:hypothetical protein
MRPLELALPSGPLALRFGHEEATEVLADLPRLAHDGQRRRRTVQDLRTLRCLSRLRPTPRHVNIARGRYPKINLTNFFDQGAPGAETAFGRLCTGTQTRSRRPSQPSQSFGSKPGKR